MTLSAQDKIEIDQRAEGIIERVLQRHIDTCPHHQAYLIGKAKIVGFVLGGIVVSGVSSGSIAAILIKFFGA